MLDYIFLCCLEFAVMNSLYQEVVLKPKQVVCLESVYLGNDVMCVLPTGYRKSLIFDLLPMLLFTRLKLKCGDLIIDWRSQGICTATVNSIVIVVSPLSLISDQIQRLNLSGTQASAIGVKDARHELDEDDTEEDTEEDTEDIDFWLCEEQKLCDGQYHIVFAHPDSFISSKYGRD